MRNSLTILDSGPLVAALSKSDAHHAWACDQLRHAALPCLTCEAVLSETFFRIRSDGKAGRALAAMIDENAFKLVPMRTAGAIARTVLRYRVDFADACLVALSEDYPSATILTIDRRDFSILRRFGNERIPFVAPE